MRPPLPDGYRWTGEPWGEALRCTPLDAFAAHLFSTRQPVFTADADLTSIGASVGASRVVMVTQVHGAYVLDVPADGPLPDPALEADALISTRTDLALAVRTADCVPLLMADRARGAVAAVHAGWRGTAAGIAAATLAAMTRVYGTHPADVLVAIGPSIGPCCYEVGSDVVDAFAAAGHERHLIQRWFATPPSPRGSRERRQLRLNVAGANRDQLVLAGVAEDQILDAGLCTAMHTDLLTSYRVERERAGRMVAVIRAGSSARG